MRSSGDKDAKDMTPEFTRGESGGVSVADRGVCRGDGNVLVVGE